MNLERALANSENEVIKLLVNVLGTGNALALVKMAGGTPLYIPTIETISKEERDSEIYQQYTEGATFKSLSRKYGHTKKTIREIVNLEKEKRRK